MALISEPVSIYSEYKKIDKGPINVGIPKSDASLSYLLKTNNVDNIEVLQLDDYVKKKQPLRIYVSSLPRTWETAFLLFLPFLNNSSSTDYDDDYTPVLVLVVSPFLREKENKALNASNVPGDLADNIIQFLKFINFIILLSNTPENLNLGLDDMYSVSIPYLFTGNATNTANVLFPGNPKKFNIILEFTPEIKLYVSVDTTDQDNIVFKYDLSHTGISDGKKKKVNQNLANKIVLTEENLKHISKIYYHTTQKIDESPYRHASIVEYTSYNNKMSKMSEPIQVSLPFALTQMNQSNFHDFTEFSNYFPDIFNYLKWVITIKKHPKNVPIFAVSHSNTMQKFLKKIFHCFSNSNNGMLLPSNSFIETYNYSIKTNMWSFQLNYMGYSVIIFRHGFSCDNMYKAAGLTSAGSRSREYSTNLSIWGIYSIKYFFSNEYDSIRNSAKDVRKIGLSVKCGIEQQPSQLIKPNDFKYEITCGKIDSRFNKDIIDESVNFQGVKLVIPSEDKELQKNMQPALSVNPFLYSDSVSDSVLDTDIDKDIQSLISIEFTNSPSKSFFSKNSFGCIKLSCVYTKRCAIIKPFTDKNKIKYEISLYDKDGGKITKDYIELILNKESIILVYEKILLFLFNIEDTTDPSSDSCILSNFNISCIVNILMDKKINRIVSMLVNETQSKIGIDTSLYDIEGEESSSVVSFPLFIYVSELLRTWETAVLLFLSNRNKKLILYISPYLREKGLLTFSSDIPGELKEQVNEFIRFISFLIYLKKLRIVNVSSLIPNKFSITINHFSGQFDDAFISDMNKPKDIGLSISAGDILIDVDINEDAVTSNPDKINSDLEKKLTLMYENIEIPNIKGYIPYNDNPDTKLTFPSESPIRDQGSMDKPSTPPGSLADFMGWYESLPTKPDIRNSGGVVYVVCHSGTMKKFLEQLLQNGPAKPSQLFTTESNQALDTNTWSLFYSKGNNKFKVFRHAFSCDNELMEKGITTTFERLKVGDYTHLASWGLLSTLVFSSKIIEKLIKDDTISNQGLKISKGMKLEPKELLNSRDYDNVSVLCGEQRDRFKVGTFVLSLGKCGKLAMSDIIGYEHCIQIITKPGGKKVVLYYNNQSPSSIEARFFNSVNSNQYIKKDNIGLSSSSLKDNLTTIVQHLTKKANNQKNIDIYTDELQRTISSFINRTLSKTLWKTLWEGISKPSPLSSATSIGGRNTKKIRRYKKRNVMNKYTIKK